MSKRRLTEKQQRTISAGKNRHSTSNDTSTLSGTVISHHGRDLIALTASGETIQCRLRQNIGSIVCGDRILYTVEDVGSADEQAVVIALGERDNLLQKTGFGNKAKAVAANIDQVVIVCALAPKPNLYLIDRYLVATENLPARPLLVINKTDLMDEASEYIVNDINAIYGDIGYRVIETSATRMNGLDELQSELDGKTSILVGLSGVGKSSLIKDLLPEIDIRIGEISVASQEGKHTTTVSSLYLIPEGGKLIDSPGVRDFTPANLERKEILNGFIELKPYRGRCKFANCTHDHEPGCAIKDALAKGEVSQQRVDSFRKMLADID
jgi:ribosome biogenesis GTPase